MGILDFIKGLQDRWGVKSVVAMVAMYCEYQLATVENPAITETMRIVMAGAIAVIACVFFFARLQEKKENGNVETPND